MRNLTLISILIICIFQNYGFSQDLKDEKGININANIIENQLILDFEISNTNEYDLIIPGFEWFITGWVNDSPIDSYFGHLKTINAITYDNKLSYKKRNNYFLADGEINYKIKVMPKFIIIKPNQTKKIKIFISKSNLPKDFFLNKEYKFDFELAIADNDILSDFESIYNFELDKYIVDKEEYVLKLKKYHKGRYYFTCEDFNSKTKLNECFSNIFYIAFKKQINLIGFIKIKE